MAGSWVGRILTQNSSWEAGLKLGRDSGFVQAEMLEEKTERRKEHTCASPVWCNRSTRYGFSAEHMGKVTENFA